MPVNIWKLNQDNMTVMIAVCEAAIPVCNNDSQTL